MAAGILPLPSMSLNVEVVEEEVAEVVKEVEVARVNILAKTI